MEPGKEQVTSLMRPYHSRGQLHACYDACLAEIFSESRLCIRKSTCHFHLLLLSGLSNERFCLVLTSGLLVGVI